MPAPESVKGRKSIRATEKEGIWGLKGRGRDQEEKEFKHKRKGRETESMRVTEKDGIWDQRKNEWKKRKTWRIGTEESFSFSFSCCREKKNLGNRGRMI